MWQQWVNFILGLWVILSGYLNLSAQGYATDLTITGIVMAALAIWGALEYRSHHDHQYRTS